MATVSDIEILADPVGFTAGILGHDIWRIPAQILESLAKNRHTAARLDFGHRFVSQRREFRRVEWLG